MTNLLEKRELLTNASYRYNFDREIYVNRSARKVFSLEFIEDHGEDELRRLIQAENREGWSFYFNAAPSLSVKQALQREIEALSA